MKMENAIEQESVGPEDALSQTEGKKSHDSIPPINAYQIKPSLQEK